MLIAVTTITEMVILYKYVEIIIIIIIKITAKFSASRRLRFEDTKRIMSPETRPKSFGTFEKQALNSLKLITWSYSIYSRTLLDRFDQARSVKKQ